MDLVVEGGSDEGAARRVVEAAGHAVVRVYVVRGTGNLDRRITNYSRAARTTPWVVFRDSDNACPVELRTRLLAGIPENPRFSLRIAHTMTEAWLMADRKGFADYFKVSVGTVPADPEAEPHAKRSLLALCLKSRNRDIREEVAFDEAHPGPLFTDHLNGFATRHWDIETAAQNSPSLRRAIAALAAMPNGASE
ncbi:hypothetical protein [Luteococcus sanguinis]|uniref:Uncharacterized protein n=1 Tax=Luteococcus sanguinis TaxID=174038 RepID=A0ABW1WZD8_9ACTN